MIDTPEDLTEKGFSAEAKKLRKDNDGLKKDLTKLESDLLKENALKNERLSAHSTTWTEYDSANRTTNETLRTIQDVNYSTEQEINRISKEIQKLEGHNEGLSSQKNINDNSIASLTGALLTLKKDFEASSANYKDYIVQVNEQNSHLRESVSTYRKWVDDNGNKIKDLQSRLDNETKTLDHISKCHDDIKAIDYQNRIERVRSNLEKAESKRRSMQDEVESAHEKFTRKVKLFEEDKAEHDAENERQMNKIQDLLEKIKNSQEDINSLETER